MNAEVSTGTRLRWIGPLASLLVFGVVAFVLHRELAHLHTREILEELRQTPRLHVLIALGFTTASYWLLGFYDLLGLRYLGKSVAYARALLTSASVAETWLVVLTDVIGTFTPAASAAARASAKSAFALS